MVKLLISDILEMLKMCFCEPKSDREIIAEWLDTPQKRHEFQKALTKLENSREKSLKCIIGDEEVVISVDY